MSSEILVLNSSKCKDDLYYTLPSLVSFVKPKGKLIGVSEVTADFSMSSSADPVLNEDGDTEEELTLQELLPAMSSSNGVSHDSYASITGSPVHKSIVVKGLFSFQPLFKDRLKRVRGMSRYSVNSTGDCISTNNCIFIGDLVLGNYDCKSELAVVTKIKYRNKQITSIDPSKAEEERSIFIIKKVEITDDGEKVYFTGTLAYDEVSLPAKDCYAMAPEVCVKDGVTTYCFDKQLMLDIGVQISISKPTPIAAADSSKCKFAAS